ncbi:MAG: glycosyl transferase [Muribaculum sp.]|nr:glycosyl transferase [Muribaculum sp.]
MVDKVEVKDYVSHILGDEIVIPTLKIWNSAEEISLDELPNKFVLKCTHDSGSILICKDKNQLNLNSIISDFSKTLKTNYYRHVREWPYKNVKPRLIVEPYLSELAVDDLIDYKFFCFNGKVAFCQVIKNRSTSETIDFFDIHWNHQDFIGLNPNVVDHSKIEIHKPKNYERMVEYASILSNGIPFVRVDFYNISGKIYFGELTFFPANGFGEFKPDIWNERIGNLIDLSNCR